MSVLWFKFIRGLMFFELVSILFTIVPDYGNEYTTKENKNWTSFKNFAPKLNLNHNICISYGNSRMMKISTNQIIVFNINNQPAIQHFFQKVNNKINLIHPNSTASS